MTYDALFAEIDRRRALGHEYIQLTVRRRRDPKGMSVRVLPGIMGRFVGRIDDHRILVDCKLADFPDVSAPCSDTATGKP